MRIERLRFSPRTVSDSSCATKANATVLHVSFTLVPVVLLSHQWFSTNSNKQTNRNLRYSQNNPNGGYADFTFKFGPFMVLKKKLKDVPDIFRLCHDSFKDTAAIWWWRKTSVQLIIRQNNKNGDVCASMTSRSYRAISCVKTRPFIPWKPPLYSPQHGGKRQIWERNIISEAKMDITESQKWLNVSLKAHLDSVTSLTDVVFFSLFWLPLASFCH